MVNYEFFYPGADDNLSPTYKSKDYEDIGSSSVANIGTALDARTANQLGELRTKINPGQKFIEVGAVNNETWESIPEQHIEEMRRAMILAGVKPSFHAPIIEASGFGKEGWEESNRESAERQIESAVMRSQRLDPEGNISVTLHATKELPEMIKRIKVKEGGNEVEKVIGTFVIDPTSGRAMPLEQGERYFQEGEKFTGKKIEFNPKAELNKLNELQWQNKLSGINMHVGNGESSIIHAVQGLVRDETDPQKKEEKERKAYTVLGKLQKGYDINKLAQEEQIKKETIQELAHGASHGAIYLKDAYANIRVLFDQAYSSANPEDKKKLAEFADWAAPKVKNGLNFAPEEFKDFREVVGRGLKVLGEIKTPETFKPLNEFIIDKSSQTFANVATKAYREFKDKAPVINIENPPAGGGLSRAEDLRKLIEASREKLKENLIKEGLGKSQAEEQAKKMIGATWDVGHINLLRKEGYSEKDMVKQAEIIAPFVKHVHLSDNFGFEHTELPMGMGNVPMKEILKKLGEKGFEGKKIVEAGNWWQYFADQGGGNPFKPTIEAFNSPIYAMKSGPTWGELSPASSYYSGYGTINPPTHHQIYGAGFTSLPVELGGNMPGSGDASRFSGAPNQ